MYKQQQQRLWADMDDGQDEDLDYGDDYDDEYGSQSYQYAMQAQHPDMIEGSGGSQEYYDEEDISDQSGLIREEILR